MSTSKFQDIRASLKTVIEARLTSDSVTGVDVFAYPPVGDVAREDMVWFGRISSAKISIVVRMVHLRAGSLTFGTGAKSARERMPDRLPATSPATNFGLSKCRCCAPWPKLFPRAAT